MPLTCDGAGLLWPDVAWRLALLAPNLAGLPAISLAALMFERPQGNWGTAACPPPGGLFGTGIGAATSGEFGRQLLALRGGPLPGGVGGRPMRCSPAPSVHGGESGRVVRDERGGGGGGEGGAGRPGLT